MDTFTLWGNLEYHNRDFAWFHLSSSMTPSDVDAMTALAILSIGVPIMAAVSLFLYFRRRKKNNHY